MGTQLTLLLGLGGIFLAVFVLLVAGGNLTQERTQVGRSLKAVQALRSAPQQAREDVDQPFLDRVLAPGLKRFTDLGASLTAGGRGERLQRRLDLAGNPTGWDVERIVAFKLLGALLGGAGALAIATVLGATLFQILGSTVASAAIGFLAPNLALYQSGYNRTQQMRKDLPDAIDLLTISVEAGLAFDAALAQVARNTTGPVAEEFFRVLQEMQIGLGRSQAMRALGERSDLPEIKGFVSAMVQADTFGIPVSRVLRVQSKELRIKRSQRAEEMAQKVPVKILFPLIFCILPALFIVVIGPAGISIFRNIV